MSKTRIFTKSVETTDNRIVTVMGLQHEIVKTEVTHSNPVYVHKGAVKYEMKQEKKKVQRLDLVIAIKHSDDKANEKVLASVLNRRMKRKQYHMSISCPQYMGYDFCQAIVDAEASYIAEHVDDFCKKVKTYK